VTAVPRRGTGPSDDGPAVQIDPFAPAAAVADAVLYEGYLLYPYRRSAAKNRVRWQFGVLAPRPFVEADGPTDILVAGSADAWHQRTEVLVEAPDDAEVAVRLRFLQVSRRTVEQRTGGGWAAVDDLEIDGERHFAFDEARPREFDVVARLADLTAQPHEVALTAAGERTVEPLAAGTARLVRESRPVPVRVRLEAGPAPAPFRLHRLRVVVENTSTATPPSRPEALRVALVAAHTLLAVRGGRFLSLLDPPLWAADAARTCRNVHTFPVLCDRAVVLSSPIILYDHPRIAPESPGPLFDSGEIDEILSLRTRTLTDEEKREARATDPQAAALLDRVDSLPDEVLARLHGAVRSLRPVPPQPEPLLVGGVRIGPGSRVRLRPRRHGTDAQDLFLAGRSATVDEVLDDVDGGRFVAVTLDDDPGADLLREYGRHYQFTPDEIEALP
jgi:hypothetical protein